MKYGSMFSGIEAATVAWHLLGWEPAWFAEIEAFPSAVLKHRFPDVPNLGDVTKVDWNAVEPIDLLVFGSPCQSFSVAGKRLGMDDPRGNLALYSLAVANQLRPRWFVFENVPGLLSSDGGRDFGRFLAAVGECGYQCAWRILDAQYFGVPQRRRRVFVVGYLGDWRRAAAVLFERHSLQGHSPPSREAGEGVAGTLAPGAHPGGFNGRDAESGMLIVYRETGQGWWTEGQMSLRAEPGGMPENVVAYQATGRPGDVVGVHAPDVGKGDGMAVAIQERALSDRDHSGPGGKGWQEDVAYTMEARHRPQHVGYGMAVRRILPVEAERLQGFPDHWTLVPYRGKPAADGNRYKALGNSMAVPCMAWLGQRIQMVEDLSRDLETEEAA